MNTNEAYNEFLRKNRLRQNRNINFIMQQCVLIGPLIALGIKLGIFPYISYKSCVIVTMMIIALSLLDTLIVRYFSHISQTTYLGLSMLELVLVYMSQMHMGIYMTLFLVPFLSLVYCDRKVYIITSVYCLPGLFVMTYLTASFQSSFRTDMDAFHWFIGQMGGYLIEYGVMFLCGLALNKMLCDHFRKLYDTRIEADTEKQLREEIFRISNTDTLTGLANRQAFMTEVHELSLESSGKEITVVWMDVNNLKGANDTLGHAAGDVLIKAAAECITNTFSEYGKCFRVGGDEFVALLNSPHPASGELLKRLEDSCAGYRNLPEGVQLTIACGFASQTDHPEYDISALLKCADKEMYIHKGEYYMREGHDRRKR